MADEWEPVEDPDMVALFQQFWDDAPKRPTKPMGASLVPGNVPEEVEVHSGQPPTINYKLRDFDHKGLYLRDKILVAAHMQGPNMNQEEILNVLPNKELSHKLKDHRKYPLMLGVKQGSQVLSCGNGEQPKLQLEDVNITSLFHKGQEAERFTFIKTWNTYIHRFESAAHPGWYLCSSVEAHKPLSLTNRLGETSITDFYFNQNKP